MNVSEYLDGLYPLGTSVAFFMCSPEQLVEDLLGLGERHLVQGTVEGVLQSFSSRISGLRYVVVPLGVWSMVLDDSPASDLWRLRGINTRTGCFGVGALSIRRYGARNGRGGHEGTFMEVATGPKTLRVIELRCDDGRWSWLTSGEPLPFEDTSSYSDRVKRKRLNRTQLY
jgi:hypothetical protein